MCDKVFESFKCKTISARVSRPYLFEPFLVAGLRGKERICASPDSVITL